MSNNARKSPLIYMLFLFFTLDKKVPRFTFTLDKKVPRSLVLTTWFFAPPFCSCNNNTVQYVRLREND